MKLKYEDYLKSGTQELRRFLSSAEVDDGEKEAVITAFAEELSKNIGNTEMLQDYEWVIYNASIKYIYSKISSVLVASKASYNDYKVALSLCKQGQNIQQDFISKKWVFPELNNMDLKQCEKALEERCDVTSITEKIVEEDHKIDELLGKIQIELSVAMCDDALSIIEEMSANIAKCKQRKISIPPINNKNTKKVSKKILDIRNVAEQKENLHKGILENDNRIHDYILGNKTSSKECREFIKLCKKQIDLISDCKEKQWTIPLIQHNNLEDEINKYEHYQKMNKIDKQIAKKGGVSLLGKKQYEIFLDNCNKQKDNITICQKNNWKLPEIIIRDPMKLVNDVKEMKKRRKQKCIARFYAAIIVLILVIIVCGIKEYMSGKARIPFDASYAVNEDLELIYNELKSAGFSNIQKKSDDSGWANSNEVLRVTIDNQTDFSKGKYEDVDVRVVITYSSSDRICVNDKLKDWQNTDYQTIVATLKKKGFSNIDIKEVATDNAMQDKKTASIVLNGKKYTNESCYIPKNAPITISYYAWKIAIGNSNNEFIGQSYKTVVSNLQNSGFTNVQTEEIFAGWGKENTVIGVTVNNKNTYNSNEVFESDTQIVVKYSSGERIDITKVMEDWNKKNYELVYNDLKNKGLNNITLKKRITNDKTSNQLISNITINNEIFKTGDCYVRKDAAVVIEYYVLKITPGKKASSYTLNIEGNYSSVVSELKDTGFTNIQLYRNNNLINGLITKEGSIASISIAGNDGFSETDSFYYDDPIVIVVNTFSDRGCEDIIDSQ